MHPGAETPCPSQYYSKLYALQQRVVLHSTFWHDKHLSTKDLCFAFGKKVAGPPNRLVDRTKHDIVGTLASKTCKEFHKGWQNSYLTSFVETVNLMDIFNHCEGLASMAVVDISNT